MEMICRKQKKKKMQILPKLKCKQRILPKLKKPNPPKKGHVNVVQQTKTNKQNGRGKHQKSHEKKNIKFLPKNIYLIPKSSCGSRRAAGCLLPLLVLCKPTWKANSTMSVIDIGPHTPTKKEGMVWGVRRQMNENVMHKNEYPPKNVNESTLPTKKKKKKKAETEKVRREGKGKDGKTRRKGRERKRKRGRRKEDWKSGKE